LTKKLRGTVHQALKGKNKKNKIKKKTEWERVDWIHLAQVRDQWQTLEKSVMNLWVP
jgi:hypothetical protein